MWGIHEGQRSGWGLGEPPRGCVSPHRHPEACRGSSPGPAPPCRFSPPQGCAGWLAPRWTAHTVGIKAPAPADPTPAVVETGRF